AFSQSLASKEPDQGLIAALHLIKILDSGPPACYAREAARAACLHNVLPKLNDGRGELPLTWEDYPIVCLLILCDQLETWDRERHDPTIWDDIPSRAELSELRIVETSGREQLHIAIDYIAPAHLSHATETYQKVKLDLESVLRNHPDAALNRLRKPWPF